MPIDPKIDARKVYGDVLAREQYEISIKNVMDKTLLEIMVKEEKQRIMGQYGSRFLFDDARELKIDIGGEYPNQRYSVTFAYTVYLKPEVKDAKPKDDSIEKKIDV
jgi:hypothetical protein